MSKRIYSRHTLVVIAVIGLAIFLLYQTYARVAGEPASVMSNLLLGLGLPIVISIAALATTPLRKEIETSFVYFFDVLRGGGEGFLERLGDFGLRERPVRGQDCSGCGRGDEQSRQ